MCSSVCVYGMVRACAPTHMALYRMCMRTSVVLHIIPNTQTTLATPTVSL